MGDEELRKSCKLSHIFARVNMILIHVIFSHNYVESLVYLKDVINQMFKYKNIFVNIILEWWKCLK